MKIKRIMPLLVGMATAVVFLQSALPAIAHQSGQSGEVSITFHAQPGDSPLVNRPSLVWVHLEKDDVVVTRSQCQNCRLEMLSPDGQVLNEFSGAELQPVSIQGHEGAFGSPMTFGRPGDFGVRFRGTVGGTSVNMVFKVPVRAASDQSGY